MRFKPGTKHRKIYKHLLTKKNPFHIEEIQKDLQISKKSSVSTCLRRLEFYGYIKQTGEKIKIGPKAYAKLWTVKKRRRTMGRIEMIRKEMRDGKEVEVWYDGKKVTPEEAKSKGLKRYFLPASPCYQGHVSERYVTSNACCTCAFINQRNRDAKKKKREDANRIYKKSPANITRSVAALYGDKGFTSSTVVKEFPDMGKKNAQQNITRLKHEGTIEGTGEKDGREMVVRTTPKFWKTYKKMIKSFMEWNPGKNFEIKQNFDRAGIAPPETEPEKIEEARQVTQQAVPAPDFQLVETPMALVGRGIWEYIEQLRSTNNYEAFTDKIESLKRSLRDVTDKYDHAVKANRKLSEGYTKLQREHFDLKAKAQGMETRLIDMEILIKGRTSGTFTMSEMAKVRELFPKGNGQNGAHP